MSAIEYAVTNPATGETLKKFDTISDDALRAAIGRAHDARHGWGRDTSVEERAKVIARVAELYTERRQELAEIITREMGKPIEQAARRGRLQRRDLPVLRRQRGEAARRRADRPARRRGLGVHPPQPGRPAAGDHAVELPLLPGGALRRPEPGDRQHDPAQARAAVPGVGRRDGGDLPRRRRPAGRLHQHLRDQRADRVGHRRPARAGRVADRLGPRGRRGGRDRRAPPQEGRARARRLGPVHRARHRRPRRRRRAGRRRPAGEHRPGVQRRQAVHRRRRPLSAVRREVHRGADRGRAGRPVVVGHDASARCRRPPPPTGSRRRSSRPSTAARRSPRAAGREGNFFKTAVITDIAKDNPAYTEEFFGPVAQVYKVGSEAEAIELANDTPFGLGSYVFTSDKEQALRVADRSRPGWSSSTSSVRRASSCPSAA